MKKSDFESLPIPHALTFIAEQAGVKWDAEGGEELPEMMAISNNGYGYKVIGARSDLSLQKANEAVRLLELIPEIRRLANKEWRAYDAGDISSRICAIHDLLVGAKP